MAAATVSAPALASAKPLNSMRPMFPGRRSSLTKPAFCLRVMSLRRLIISGDCLLPVGGDVVTGLVQAGLVLVALRHYKVPRPVAARMMANVLLDVAIGSIPFLGDLFDAGFKANTRNVRLLQPSGHPSTIEVQPHRTPWRYIVPIAAVLLVALALVLVVFITVVRWLFGF